MSDLADLFVLNLIYVGPHLQSTKSNEYQHVTAKAFTQMLSG